MADAVTLGSVCTGYGGLDMSVNAVLPTRTLWHCEFEPPTPKNPRPSQGAARLLAHRFPGVPNHGDVSVVDWSRVEPVDVLTAGFPCQDVSSAGHRRGLRAGTRSGLWFQVARAIDGLRPGLVVLENVRGLLSADADCQVEPCAGCVGDRPDVTALRALGAVLGDLADLGYDAVWCGLRAADAGAAHGRFRVFIAAADADDGGLGSVLDRVRPRQSDAGGRGGDAVADADRGERNGRESDPLGGSVGRDAVAGHRQSGGGSPVAADPSGARREGLRSEPARLGSERGCAAVADSDGDGRERLAQRGGEPEGSEAVDGDGGVDAVGRVLAWGQYAPAVDRWAGVVGRPAPAPTVDGRSGPRLNPEFSEWLMGLPAGWVTGVPGLSRNDQLRLIGNGVVPQQGAAALACLLPLLGQARDHDSLGLFPAAG